MNALRWILGTIGVLFVGGFLVLAVLGNAFRKSFGASENGPLFIALPVVGAALLVAAVIFPECKPLLHAAAVAAFGLVAFCLWQIFQEGEAPLWFAIAYLVVWFFYYWLATRGVATPS